jgi:hypothetical protein
VIIKDVDSIITTDKFLKAGFHAEQQMSYYLKRAFGDAQDILVLNGIRLESGGDSAQIDHLIIHKYGMIIVESKSVFGSIKINEYGEWLRLEYKIGMASPVEQAKRQATFLKKYLNESGLKLPHDAFKSVFHKITFNNIPIDILVAISDTGIINRPKTLQTDNIYKADMITGKVKEIIENYKKQDNILNLNLKPTPLKITPETMIDIALLLKKKHTPLPVKQDNDAPPISAPINMGVSCRKCGGDNIIIVYGKFGYYFKCRKCNENTSIKEHCSTCGEQSKLRKDGNQFYIECKKCNSSKPFFKNAD